MVIAAEASADLHAASVIRVLRKKVDNLEVFGLAGPLLRNEGVEAVSRTEEISVMGLVEVVPALPRILKIMRKLEEEAACRKPDLALLVDSPDLNLRIAKSLKRLGIPVLYYIAPMVWAWRSGRIDEVARLVDSLCVILPFEEKIWKNKGVNAVYVGHPVMESHEAKLSEVCTGEKGDEKSGFVSNENRKENKRGAFKIALLPGSRQMEIRRCFPPMIEALRDLINRPGINVEGMLLPAPTIDTEWLFKFAESFCPDFSGLPLRRFSGRAEELFRESDVAIVTSGTATLEALVNDSPQVVIYRAAWSTWLAARILLKKPYVSLPNLLAGREVVREYLQWLDPVSIADEICRLMPGTSGRKKMLDEYRLIKKALGTGGASEKVADEILRMT